MIKNRICLVPSVSSVGRLRHRGNNRMADLFIKQFCYNIDVAPTRHELEIMHQKPDESFPTYVGRFRATASNQ